MSTMFVYVVYAHTKHSEPLLHLQIMMTKFNNELYLRRILTVEIRLFLSNPTSTHNATDNHGREDS